MSDFGYIYLHKVTNRMKYMYHVPLMEIITVCEGVKYRSLPILQALSCTHRELPCTFKTTGTFTD